MRPAVAVILPFHGSREEAVEALARLGHLRRGPEDEALLVDNTENAVASGLPRPDGVQVVVSEVSRSAYAARNIGAERSRAPWLLFVDADVQMQPDALDRYFDHPPADDAGLVSGGLVGTVGQPGVIPDYIRARRHLENEDLLEHPFRPMAVTANLLVRREAFDAVGGFQEETRAGADADLCWRIQDAGWRLAHCPAARGEHDHRATLHALLVQTRRDGASVPWLEARHPGYDARVRPRLLLRAVAGAVGWPVLGRPRRGLYKAIDGLWLMAFAVGAGDSNRPPRDLVPANLVLFAQEWPRRDDPLVQALCREAAAGRRVRVEALRRPEVPDWSTGRLVPACFREDETPRERLRAAARLAAGGRRLALADAPAALRVAGDAPDATILTEPSVREIAERALGAGRVADDSTQLLSEPAPLPVR